MFRNPNEGISKFLGSVGDMRRTWEQEEQVRQREARLAEQHKQNIDKGALDMTLAQSGEERLKTEAAHKAAMRPGELVQQGQQTTLNSARLTESQQQIKNLEHQYNLAVKYGDKEAQAKLGSLLASTDASRASAANSGVQTRRNQLALDQETLVNQDLLNMWGKPASSLPGAPTIGETQTLGGIDKTPWGMDYSRNTELYNTWMNNINRTISAKQQPTQAQIDQLNALGSKLQLPPVSMEQLVLQSVAGTSVLDRTLGNTGRGGTSAGSNAAQLSGDLSTFNGTRR